MQLPLSARLKLLRQRLYAAVQYNGNVGVSLEEAPEGLFVRVEDRRIMVPSPLRWKLYRKGWQGRLDKLAHEYGVGRHFQIRQGDVVFDIGANAGEFAHIAAAHGASVHCFEPDLAVFKCLNWNTRDLIDVTLHGDVVWNTDGDVPFVSDPARADSSVFGSGETTMRPARTIETIAKSLEIKRINLLKCDAEGAEPEVLTGAGAFLQKIGGVAIDTGAERNGERTHEACAGILSKAGFTVIEEKIGTRWMTYGVRKDAMRAGSR